MEKRAVVICFVASICHFSSSGFGATDLAIARAALDRDDYKSAAAIAEKASAEDPSNPEAWIVLGHALYGQIDQASLLKKGSLAKRTLAAYTQASALAPKNVEAHNSLLEYYRQAPAVVGGDRAKAIKEAETIAPLDAGLGYAWLVRLALEDNRLIDASQSLDALIKVEPKSYRSLYWFGVFCDITGKDLRVAADALRRAILTLRSEDDPPIEEAHLHLGHILEQLGEKHDAVEAYTAAVALNHSVGDAKSRIKKLLSEKK